MLVIATLARNWATITTDIIVAPAAVETLERTRTGAIVGGTLMRKDGWKIGQRIPLQTPVPQRDGSTTWAFDIVGVLEMKDPVKRAEHSTIVIVNYSYYDEARLAGKGTVQQLILRVDDPQQGAVVAANIDKLFANSSNETRTESLREMSLSEMQSIGDLDFIVHSVSAAVLFSLLFSVGSTMMQSTRERTAELAVLKTLGFSDRLVVALLVIEALLLCLTAAASGLGLAALLLWLATRMDLVSTHLLLSTTGLITGAAWAVTLALVSSTLPAWRSLQLRVVTALGVR
jgi:putative ABC transport system permease protein